MTTPARRAWIEQQVMEWLGGSAFKFEMVTAGALGKLLLDTMQFADAHPVGQTEMFCCRECGDGVAADEDGCCTMCGRDCEIKPYTPTPADPQGVRECLEALLKAAVGVDETWDFQLVGLSVK